MSIQDGTLSAIRRTLRVFDRSAVKLSGIQLRECLDFIRTTPLSSAAHRDFVLACQAAVFSSQARKLAETLIGRITVPGAFTVDGPSYGLVGRSLDVALFDTYRQADPLSFDAVVGAIDAAAASLREFDFSAARDLSLAQTRYFDRLTRVIADIFVPLLNTEHQGDVAELIEAYLRIVPKVGTHKVPDNYLLAILRRSYTPARTVFHPDALASLRAAAIDVAKCRIQDAPSFSPFHEQGNRATAFRFLLFTNDIERQMQTLHMLAREAREHPSESTLNQLVNNLAWAHETTLDEGVTLLAERLFLEMDGQAQTHQYLSMCTRFGDRERGKQWIEDAASRPASINSRYLEAKFWLSFAEPDLAINAAMKPLSVFSARDQQMSPQSMKTWLKRQIKEKVLRRPAIARNAPDALVLYNLVRTAQEAIFLSDLQSFSAASRKSPRTDNSTTIVVVSNHLHFLAQMPVAAIERARMDGAEIVSLINGMYPSSDNLSPAARRLKDILVPPYYFNKNRPSHAVSDAWEIDAQKRVFSYKGINYYFGIHNSLGIIFRRFNINYQNPIEQTQLRRHLVLFQNVHDAFDEFVAEMDPARQYQFLAAGVQFGVGYAIRTLVSNANLKNVRIIHVSNGFEAFDSEWQIDPTSENPVASYHSVADLTDFPDTPLGFRPKPEDCQSFTYRTEQAYFDANPVVKGYFEKIDARADIARTNHRPVKHPKRRVLMLGTILPDLSIPQDRGFIHDDIAHWVRDTVRIADEEDLTLVVKQHPAELNHKIGFYVSERFSELVPQGAKNVEILPYEENFYDAIMSSDIVILWSGTSTIELAAMGRPYLACSVFAQQEYPLFADSFTSESEYRSILNGSTPLEARSDARLRAIDLVHRISTSPMREPSQMPVRQLLNAQAWPPRIDPGSAEALLNDEAIIRLSKRLSPTRP